MPEGDTVWRTAQRLHAALAGTVLVTAELRWPSLATSDLRGRRVLEVSSAGKHLLTRLDAAGDQPLTLHSHLKMEGSWRIHRAAATARRAGPDVRAVLENDEWAALGLRLGALDLVATADEATLVGHLGPDVLGQAWDPERAVDNLLEDPARPVGEALLDQRVLAGVGTFWMSEALFVRGITPWTPVGDAGDPAELVALVHRMLDLGRRSPVQSTTGDTRPGRHQYVHARSGRPCRRCGSTVRVARLGAPPRDRTAFYCPRCQRGPAPTDDQRPQRPLGASPRRRRAV